MAALCQACPDEERTAFLGLALRIARCMSTPTPPAPSSAPTSPAASALTGLQSLSLRQRLARVTPYFWGDQRWAWALAVLATLIGAATEPLIPALLKPLLDNGFTEGSLNLWLVPLFIVGLFFIRGLAQFTGQYALSRIANDGMLALRKDLFSHVQRAQMGLFSRHSASALSNTVVYEVQTGANYLVDAFLVISRDGFTLVALLAYLLYLNWQLTLAVAVIVPGVSFIMKTLSKRLYRITKTSQQATDALAYVVEENVLAHRVVRIHGAQAQQNTRFVQLSRQCAGSTLNRPLPRPP